MKYTLTVSNTDGSENGFDVQTYSSLESACDCVVTYLNDEYNENPGCSTFRDLYAAIGIACTGFATGGNFEVMFQGEKLRVNVLYDNLAELVAVHDEAEKFAATQSDDDMPSDEDLAMHAGEIRNVLVLHGRADSQWTMIVDSTTTDGPGLGKFSHEYNVAVSGRMVVGLCARRGYRMGGAEMSRLRHTGRFVAGQTIRGYSFAGRTDSYLQGVVRDANYTRPHDGVLCYEIEVTVEMFGGEDITTPNDIGWIPHEVSLFEYDGRILEVPSKP